MMQQKKLLRRLAAFAACMTAALTVLTLPVCAASRSYYVSSYASDVAVQKNGDALVRDDITYDFDGSFHGVYVKVDSSGTNGIADMKITEEGDGGEKTFVPSDSEEDGTYQTTADGSVTQYKLYRSASDEKVTFRFSYTLRSVVKDYADAAQFQRFVIGKAWDCMLQNVSVAVHLPKGAQKQEIRAYGHGPLTGSVNIADGSTVVFTAPEISSGDENADQSYLNARILFPASLTPDAPKASGSIVASAVAEETKLANEANAARARAREIERVKKIAALVGSVVILAGLAVIFVYVYRKYDREYRTSFREKYYRELPGTYPPAVMSRFMNGSLRSRDIMATLLDLVRRRILTLEQVECERGGVFQQNGKKYDVRFTRVKNVREKEQLSASEKYLLDWLVDKVGDGSTLLLSDVTRFVDKSSSNAKSFSTHYEKWKDLVGIEYDGQNFYDKNTSAGKKTAVLSGIAALALAIVLLCVTANPFCVLPLLLGVGMIVYGARLRRRSSYGNEQHAMWEAFRRFLSDFSEMRNAGITSVAVWEQYLVYAIPLGVAKNIIRYLPEIVGASPGTSEFGTMYGMFYGMGPVNGLGSPMEHAFDKCMSSMDSAVTSSAIAASSNSSGSGFGGGFSGGGGGGGCGGGGGAF